MSEEVKATLTYRCDHPDHEQTLTVTATIQDDGMTHVVMEFNPECSDDTSDPTGLLTSTIQAFKVLTKQRRRLDEDEDFDD